jgi:O-antigen/teichoic acid export membrane protein
MAQFSLFAEKTKKWMALASLSYGHLDLSSEAGRAAARHRAIVLTALGATFSRFVSIVTILVSLPLTLHYLGPERFGMWATLSAFSLLLSFTDLGIGNSALTAVAQSVGRSEKSDLSRVISSAYGAMSLISLAILIALAITYPFVDWDRLFNVSTPIAKKESGPAAATFFIILALTGPVALINRIQSGLQQGFRSNLWQSVANMAALLALVVATQSKASLPWLVLAMAGTPVVVALINSIDFFMFRRPDIRPRLSAIEGVTMRRLSSDGALFLMLQGCAAIMFQANPIIVAQVLDAKAVAAFAVPDRLFGVIGAVLAIVLTPLWPAYGDAVARGDFEWAKRTLRRSLILSICSASMLAIMLLFAGETLIHWWIGSSVAVPFALIAGLAVWKIMEAAGNAVAMFLNGANQLGVQVACALVTTIASIVLKVWLTRSIGIAGIPLGMILSYGVFALPFLGVSASHALRQLSGAQKISKGIST